jgi:hypothetical protein
MDPATVLAWLKANEGVAVWLEAIALMAIFFWDRIDSHQQHKQTLKQMDIMEKQAASTETAANAANKNAEVLINSERAWVFAEIGQLPGNFVPSPNQVQIVNLPITFRNLGKSPGRITKLSARAYQLETSASLPAEPEYRQIGTVDILLPPNTATPQGLAMQAVSVRLAGSDFIAIQNGDEQLYVYGFIDYLDLGEKRRETHFCWRYHIPHGFDALSTGFHIMADIPPAYLQCT